MTPSPAIALLPIGLAPQPPLLPPLASGAQGLLLPSSDLAVPDLAVYVPLGQQKGLPLSGAFKPAVLWAQGVALAAGGIATTNGCTAATW